MLGVLIVATLLLISYRYHMAVDDIRRLDIVDIRDAGLDTGDVIFLRRDYVSLIEPLHYAVFNVGAWAANSGIYTHAAVVVDGMLYQTAIAPMYDDATRSYRWLGPAMSPINPYIAMYPGEAVVYRRRTPLRCRPPLDGRKMTLDPRLLAGSVYGDGSDASSRYVYCVQLVADYLKRCGVPLSREPHRVSFKSLAGDLERSGEYRAPVLLLNAYAGFKLLGADRMPASPRKN